MASTIRAIQVYRAGRSTCSTPFGNVVATTTSAADGSYSFANLGAGTYTIEEINQNGWYQTDPVNPPGTYTVTATSGSSESGLDFGNFQLVNVTGNVYNDLNGNGKLDPGEPGLKGWTVNLLDPTGNIVATTTERCQRKLRVRQPVPRHVHRFRGS